MSDSGLSGVGLPGAGSPSFVPPGRTVSAGLITKSAVDGRRVVVLGTVVAMGTVVVLAALVTLVAMGAMVACAGNEEIV